MSKETIVVRGEGLEHETIKMRVVGNHTLYSGNMNPEAEDYTGSTFPNAIFPYEFSSDAIDLGNPEIPNVPSGDIYGNIENLSISGNYGYTSSVTTSFDLSDPAQATPPDQRLEDFYFTGLVGGLVEFGMLDNITGRNKENWGNADYIRSKFVLAIEMEVPMAQGYAVRVVERPNSIHMLSCANATPGMITDPPCVYYGGIEEGHPVIPFDYALGEEIYAVRQHPKLLGINEAVYDEVVSACGGDVLALPSCVIYSGSTGYHYLFSNYIDTNTLGRTRTGAAGGGGGGSTGTCECPKLTTGDCPQIHVANCGQVGALWV
jgi:hypothetical protein